ncbi:MAG: hypothetical protein BWK73_54205 [Thiothrix lacustris]|uniref:Uncharacterized protein n=1 Tax=Thiothrix lacustris TaxID=525917 RepID=A0A1Y1Q6W1_9GAMM|nr:MAG: hypothetical protein BWK73_54205 [Thiothrix lacustris]
MLLQLVAELVQKRQIIRRTVGVKRKLEEFIIQLVKCCALLVNGGFQFELVHEGGMGLLQRGIRHLHILAHLVGYVGEVEPQ